MCLDTIVRSCDRALMRRACQGKRGFSNCPCGFKCGLDSAEQSIHEAIVCRTTLKLLVPKALGAFGICKNEDLSEPEALNIASLFLQKIPTQSSLIASIRDPSAPTPRDIELWTEGIQCLVHGCGGLRQVLAHLNVGMHLLHFSRLWLSVLLVIVELCKLLLSQCRSSVQGFFIVHDLILRLVLTSP